MNRLKTLLTFYLITIIAASLYVPWKKDLQIGSAFKGYGFVLTPHNGRFSINFNVIALEYIIITAFFILLYLYIGKEKIIAPQKNIDTNSSRSNFNFTPNMPDIMSGNEIECFLHPSYFFIYKRNVVSIGETKLKSELPLKFPLVMFVIDIKSREPVLMIGIESGFTGNHYLCFFDKHGSHANLGEISTDTSIVDFKSRSLNLVKEQLNINIDEIKSVV